MDNCKYCGHPNRDAYRCEVCGHNPYRGRDERQASVDDHRPGSESSNEWGFWKNLCFMLAAPFLAWGYVMFILPIQGVVMLLWPDGKLARQEAEAIRRREERERNMSDHDLLVSIARSTGSPSKR
jgi:hypothetical protein